MTRDYMDTQALWSTITTDAGTLALLPTSATTIYMDAAKTSYVPRYADDGEHGSTVLAIGRGVLARVGGHAELVGGSWQLGTIYACGRRGGDLTRAQIERTRDVVLKMVQAWATDHADDLARAETISRNNAAQRLEEKIEEHASALKILRRELRRCDGGRTYEGYPKLATDR